MEEKHVEVNALPNHSHLIAGRYIDSTEFLNYQAKQKRVRSERKFNGMTRYSRMKPIWLPYNNYMIKGSFKVKRPTAVSPNSYLQHFYSRKYANLLIKKDPVNYKYLSEFNYDPENANIAIRFTGTDMRTKDGRTKFASIISKTLRKNAERL